MTEINFDSNISYSSLSNTDTNINIYTLDFILHGNDEENSVKSHDLLGHGICCIHYNSQQYIHNSSTIVKYDNSCDTSKYIIPCSLIQQDWMSTIHNDQISYNVIDVKNET